jgi:adenine-specific DNA-methyltransferase
MDIKKQRGQFFTTNQKVLETLTSLIHNDGDIFEPSAGSGHIIDAIEKKRNNKIFACELDFNKIQEKICRSEIINQNFFQFIKNEKKFSTSIGNPPFVKLKNVEQDTIDLLPEKIRGNGNLYYYFIKYSLEVLEDNGELIFIVPKEWLYNTSSQFLREYLKNIGDFTHFIDCGETKLFDDADVPALCIFRFQKNYTGTTKYYNSLESYEKEIYVTKQSNFGKTISFTNGNVGIKKISDYFDVRVGLVTGLESVFKVQENNIFEDECLIQMMTTNKNLVNYLYLDNFNSIDDVPPITREFIMSKKEELLKRKIKKFTKNNWWKYGAIRNLEFMKSDKPRIYGLMKTRDNNPFWLGQPRTYFSGGVFSLFPKNNLKIDLVSVVNYLNSDEFKNVLSESNMYSNNKVSFTPTAFASLPINI